MKASFNQNDLELYPVDNEFAHGCENCVFLHTITSNSQECRLINFEEEFFRRLPRCFESIFILKPLSEIFTL